MRNVQKGVRNIFFFARANGLHMKCSRFFPLSNRFNVWLRAPSSHISSSNTATTPRTTAPNGTMKTKCTSSTFFVSFAKVDERIVEWQQGRRYCLPITKQKRRRFLSLIKNKKYNSSWTVVERDDRKRRQHQASKANK